MIPQDLQYDFPLASYGMLCVFLFLLLFWFYQIYRSHILQRYAESATLRRLMIGQSAMNFWSKVGGICLVWILVILALMQPKGDAHYVDEMGGRKADQVVKTKKKLKLHDVIFLVDVSASMGVPDGRNGSSRLQEAQELIDQIATKLGGEQAALYAFTSDVTQLSPPTMDTLFVRMMAQQMRINEGGNAGTNITKALKYIYDRFLSKATPGLKTVILLSDGGDTAIEALSGTDKQAAIKGLLKYVEAADPRSVQVFTVGLGSVVGGKVPGITEDVTSKLDDSLLKAISDRGHGHYYQASELSIVDITKDILNKVHKEDAYYEAGEEGYIAAKEEGSLVYNLYFQIPLALGILLLMAIILIPDATGKIVVLVLCLLPLNGQNLETAQNWYEAGVYDRAITLYNEMLQESMDPYKESVVRYNLGTALLEDGQWEKAVAMFRSIPLKGASPVVKRRLNTNAIVARIREEEETENLPKRIFLLREAIRDIALGDEYHCELAVIIQTPKCAPAPNLAEMRAFVENDLSMALTNLQKYQIANVNFIEGFPLLYSYLQKMKQNIRFLQEKAKTAELKESYQKLFLNVMGSWMPLWDKLYERPDPPQSFINARQFNRDAQTNLRIGDVDKTMHYLKVTEDLIVELIRRGGESTPEQESLQQLLRSYQDALLQEPVQEVTLQALQQEQKQVKSESLKDANQALESAVAFANGGKPEEARLQVEVAQQEVRNILRRKLGKLSPISILDASIEAQEHALSLARLVEQIGSSSGVQSLDLAQKQVIETATPFFQEVVRQQQEQYNETGICQRIPWETAVPLFYQGLQAARTAIPLEDKISWQEQALNYWKQASAELKREEEEEQPEEQTKAEKVIRDLQQMEQNDQQPRPEIVPSGLEGQPW